MSPFQPLLPVFTLRPILNLLGTVGDGCEERSVQGEVQDWSFLQTALKRPVKHGLKQFVQSSA